MSAPAAAPSGESRATVDPARWEPALTRAGDRGALGGGLVWAALAAAAVVISAISGYAVSRWRGRGEHAANPPSG